MSTGHSDLHGLRLWCASPTGGPRSRKMRLAMTTFEHVLHACAPVPLAGYLKALGVFRLVAEQADPVARGLWRDERFVLCTRLSEDELIRFFVDNYQPTPVVSPWNGGSGFWRN